MYSKMSKTNWNLKKKKSKIFDLLSAENMQCTQMVKFFYLLFTKYLRSKRKNYFWFKKKKNHSILIFASNTCSLFSPSTVGTRLYPPPKLRECRLQLSFLHPLLYFCLSLSFLNRLLISWDRSLLTWGWETAANK